MVNFMDGLLVTVIGLAGVFLVLTLFYFAIRLLQKAGAKEAEE